MRVSLHLLVDGRWEPADAWLDRIDELLERYAGEENLGCGCMQGGFFIDVDGVAWSDGSTVDEFWMTQGFVLGLDAILRGETDVQCSPGPWEESRLRLKREGAGLVMEDVSCSGHVSMPRVTVSLRAFAEAMAVETKKLCRLLVGLSSAARARMDAGDSRWQLAVVLESAVLAPEVAERVPDWPGLIERIARSG